MQVRGLARIRRIATLWTLLAAVAAVFAIAPAAASATPTLTVTATCGPDNNFPSLSTASVFGSGFPPYPVGTDTPLRLQTRTDRLPSWSTVRLSTDAAGAFNLPSGHSVGLVTYVESITWFARVYDDANGNFEFDPGEQQLASTDSGPVPCTPPAPDEPPAFPVLSTVEVNATSPGGAEVTYAVSATDKEDGSIAGACTPASGGTFAIGTTTVNCTANDTAGHEATANFSVVVKSASQQISDLSTLVKGINLKQGISNSLDAKFQGVRDALSSVQVGNPGTACNKLDAALNEISAQSGKDITVAQANDLIADINRIKAVIGCT